MRSFRHYIFKVRLQEWIVIAFAAFLTVLRFAAGVRSFPVLELTVSTFLFTLGQLIYFPGIIMTYVEKVPYYKPVLGLATAAAFIYLCEKNRYPFRLGGSIREFFRVLIPFSALIVFYDVLTNYHDAKNIVHILNPYDFTPILQKTDVMLLGAHPSHIMEPYISPLLTEIMYIAYGFHVFFPAFFALVFYLKKRHKLLDEYMLGIIVLVTTGMIAYLLVPGISPAYVLEYKSELKGYEMAHAIKFQIDKTRSAEMDCCVFPSVHVGLALLILGYVYRYDKRVAYVLVPLIVLSWVSTMYLRRHYFTDVVAGWVHAALVLYINPKLYIWWQKIKEKYGGDYEPPCKKVSLQEL